jgi:hypothetical protein
MTVLRSRTIRPAVCRWRWAFLMPPARRQETRSIGILGITAGKSAAMYEVSYPSGDGSIDQPFRLVRETGDVYDVILRGRYGPECSCPSWLMGRAHAATPGLRVCKHCVCLASALAGLAEGRIEGKVTSDE